MYRLRYSSGSPFVRKVLAFAIEVGLDRRIEIFPTDVWKENSDIFQDNPLGKIPSLATPDGVFVGSYAICDYLDHQHEGEPWIPRQGKARWKVLQIHGLADGATEAVVACMIETLRRPAEFVWTGNLERQSEKILRTLDALDAQADELGVNDLGAVTIGCLLGYLDFRFADKIDWRKRAPKLERWSKNFMQRESMVRTQPR